MACAFNVKFFGGVRLELVLGIDVGRHALGSARTDYVERLSKIFRLGEVVSESICSTRDTRQLLRLTAFDCPLWLATYQGYGTIRSRLYTCERDGYGVIKRALPSTVIRCEDDDRSTSYHFAHGLVPSRSALVIETYTIINEAWHVTVR